MPSAGETRAHARFYAPPPWPAPGEALILPPEEARHAGRVLRLGPGVRVQLVDGAGRVAAGELEGHHRRGLAVRLLAIERDPAEQGAGWTMLLPWLRAAARLDWAVEKGTELGCRGFCIYLAGRSMKAGCRRIEARQSRWRAVARAAMKQAGRSWWPSVAVAGGLAEALETLPAPGMLLWGDGRGAGFPEPAGGAERDAALIVGPEGGFDEGEERLLRGGAAQPVCLGAFRLRSETAAVALAALFAARQRARGRGTGEE
ncbi:MAG: 16S rRNA (uracil(1498)-N(3))-methyltransferase [Candidatus Eisenbacteria sp.]|nr:16S rRNA (uracil(1498)-N(3))-methyltransferase [Candidatus Eisenbacteria bacterium]